MLIKPYRDGGPAINGWDIVGLQVDVSVKGTLNRPGDRDEGWTVELALPWKILKEAASGQRRPASGDRWRVNFSRVEWQTDVREGKYMKRNKPGSTEPLPEDNWVWSPQGAINMHMPERWGYVQFSDTPAGSRTDTFVDDPNERVKWALRRLYYRQRSYRAAHGTYADESRRAEWVRHTSRGHRVQADDPRDRLNLRNHRSRIRQHHRPHGE